MLSPALVVTAAFALGARKPVLVTGNGVLVGVGGIGVLVGGKGVLVGPGVGVGPGGAQLASLNEPMRVRHEADPVVCTYSLVNQKVQSSTGSTESME